MSTVTVTATTQAGNAPPRIKLDVSDAGTPNLFATTVLRLDPDGVQRAVRTYDGTPLALAGSGSTRTALIYDYEAPYGAPVTYSTVESPTVATTVTLNVTQTWLVHPGLPVLSVPITVGGISERVMKVQQAVFRPMGRRYPVVRTDGQRKAAEYTLKLYAADSVKQQDIYDLLDDAGVLLLNVPPSKGWGVSAEYIAAGDVTEARVVTYLGEPARFFSMSATVVDRPAGGTQAQRTYDDIDAPAYATYAALNAAYSTYAALAAG